MNFKNRFIRPLVGLGLSLTIAFTGIPFTSTNTVQAAAYSSTSTTANNIIYTGNRYLGTPYRFGASTNTTRVFDCSSFTKYVFKRNGINLPRSSREQARVGVHVSKSNLKKGDLVFFSTRGSGRGNIAHVGIYAGNGKILHTFGNPQGVTY